MIEMMAALWICLAVYSAWYFTSAKHYFPITPDEAKILWKIHKKTAGCSSTKWRKIERRGKIIGFECQCGYKHIQKRPIVTTNSTPKIKTQTLQPTAIEKLHAPYK
ncbi:MAG: hypothetical protein QW667_02675 [Candidatus Bathyarchaeia archaeon]